MDGGNGVTCVDRALEGISGVDGDDLGYLVHVQQRGNAGQDALAIAGRRRQYMAEVPAQIGEHGGDVFR
ncbi:hypothetical protein D3C72_1811310 [compost metagenome]